MTCTARRPLPSRNKGAGTLGLGPLPTAPPSHPGSPSLPCACAGAQLPCHRATEWCVALHEGRRAGGGQAQAVWMQGAPSRGRLPLPSPNWGAGTLCARGTVAHPSPKVSGNSWRGRAGSHFLLQSRTAGGSKGPVLAPLPQALLAALPIPQASLALPAVLGQPSVCSVSPPPHPATQPASPHRPAGQSPASAHYPCRRGSPR